MGRTLAILAIFVTSWSFDLASNWPCWCLYCMRMRSLKGAIKGEATLILDLSLNWRWILIEENVAWREGTCWTTNKVVNFEWLREVSLRRNFFLLFWSKEILAKMVTVSWRFMWSCQPYQSLGLVCCQLVVQKLYLSPQNKGVIHLHWKHSKLSSRPSQSNTSLSQAKTHCQSKDIYIYCQSKDINIYIYIYIYIVILIVVATILIIQSWLWAWTWKWGMRAEGAYI